MSEKEIIMKDMLKKLAPYIIYSAILLILTFFTWGKGSDGNINGWKISLFFDWINVHGWIFFALSLLLILIKAFEYGGIWFHKAFEGTIHGIQFLFLFFMLIVSVGYGVKMGLGFLFSITVVITRTIQFLMKKNAEKEKDDEVNDE